MKTITVKLRTKLGIQLSNWQREPDVERRCDAATTHNGLRLPPDECIAWMINDEELREQLCLLP